ncbi:MAG: hypothetical protein KME30_24660 [Iphinoe sp. HA4291-MV1]|nr:hypothetical protein [Iphinoe sp. HA4291-MV1]
MGRSQKVEEIFVLCKFCGQDSGTQRKRRVSGVGAASGIGEGDTRVRRARLCS